MPKLAVPLTDIQLRTAKPKDKPYKLTDGGGLYLLRYWRMDYRFGDARRTLAFGKYPDVTLAMPPGTRQLQTPLKLWRGHGTPTS